MKAYGIDFTSAPGTRKPIAVAECSLERNRLYLEKILPLTTHGAFADFLHHEGPWIAGIDFPFGQPRKLIENLGWPISWCGYVAKVGKFNKEEFEANLADYRRGRAKGDKQHLRTTDIRANSRSPMMLYGVPVGKMFYRGAPALLGSPASIVPVRPNSDNRIIVEAYPALVVRKLVGERETAGRPKASPYKSDNPRKQTIGRRSAREKIVKELQSGGRISCYGVCLEFSEEYARRFIDDPGADYLDAFLCAIQAAWAFAQKPNNFGIPWNCDLIEGWIADPRLLLS
jgi:hypothetical protein